VEQRNCCFLEQRKAMVRQLVNYGITDNRVLDAMGIVKRHMFIPEEYREDSDPYGDHPCSIGRGQTISQPFIVAYMIEKMEPLAGERILEIGTGSGYEAAVLSLMGMDVFTVEIVPELSAHAKRELAGTAVQILTGNGYLGWPEKAPFDRVLVSCSPEKIPLTLTEQMKAGGRMILPLGKNIQRLVILEKRNGNLSLKNDLPVRFVPMVSAQ
jgi:protein-L-isoaspartate(D-aspartate) O-methyltransferase